MLTTQELFGLLGHRTLAAIVADLRDEAMIATPENRARITAATDMAMRELNYRLIDEDLTEIMIHQARFAPVRVLAPEDCP